MAAAEREQRRGAPHRPHLHHRVSIHSCDWMETAEYGRTVNCRNRASKPAGRTPTIFALDAVSRGERR